MKDFEQRKFIQSYTVSLRVTIKQQLQNPEGSHKCGWINHHSVLNQTESNLHRVEGGKKTCFHKFVK